MSAVDSPLPVAMPGSGISVERVSDLVALSAISAEWAGLLSVQVFPSYFVTWKWIAAWWKVYGTPGDLFVLLCRDADNKLIAAAPLYRRHEMEAQLKVRTLRWIGDGTDDVDGFGFLAEPAVEQCATSVLFEWLASHADEWDCLALHSMPEAQADCLSAEALRRDWFVQRDHTPHRLLSLPGSWEEYLQSLSRKARQTLLRRLRNLERDFSVSLKHCSSAREIEQGVEVVFAIHQKNWRSRGKAGKFSDPARREFFREIAQIATALQDIDLWLLELNGKPVAARLGFRMQGTRHAVIAAMDPESRKYGVGTITEALVIKECIARGDHSYDFLAGDETYKGQAGARLFHYGNLRVARPHTRAAIRLVTVTSINAGKDWLRDRFPGTYRVLKTARQKLAR
jgi:CelD/BcsL family acetyltransferase involved in cellulose biosynthesis